MKIVNEYLNGPLGYKSLKDKYGISHKSVIHQWVDDFRKWGPSAFIRTRKQDYTGDFKLEVLHYIKTNEVSMRQAANHFNIPHFSLISAWKKKFEQGGVEALLKNPGRPTMDKKRGRPRKQQNMTREKQLERENQLLRIENEYLKKLRAFQQNPDLLGKHKP
jgi:transposase